MSSQQLGHAECVTLRSYGWDLVTEHTMAPHDHSEEYIVDPIEYCECDGLTLVALKGGVDGDWSEDEWIMAENPDEIEP